MIVGIGVDIQSVCDIRKTLAASGSVWLEVVLTRSEIQGLEAAGNSTPSIAGRIAAKEAAVKAIGTGFNETVDWLDFEVLSAPSGPPMLVATGEPRKILDDKQVSKIWLSISHSGEYSVAQVILESSDILR